MLNNFHRLCRGGYDSLDCIRGGETSHKKASKKTQRHLLKRRGDEDRLGPSRTEDLPPCQERGPDRGFRVKIL